MFIDAVAYRSELRPSKWRKHGLSANVPQYRLQTRDHAPCNCHPAAVLIKPAGASSPSRKQSTTACIWRLRDGQVDGSPRKQNPDRPSGREWEV